MMTANRHFDSSMLDVWKHFCGTIGVTMLTSLLVAACGPAAPSSSSDGKDNDPKPTATIDPTVEHKIDEIVKTAVPTPSAKPSSDGEDKEPDEGDIPPPTKTPTPEPVPNVVLPPTPHPYADDIDISADFCFNVDLHNPAYRKAREAYSASGYIISQCSKLIGRTIGERCNVGPTDLADTSVQACIKREAETVKDYTFRSGLAPQCHVIGLTTDEEFLACMKAGQAKDQELRERRDAGRLALRQVIDRDAAVIAAEASAWACLDAIGKKDLASNDIDVSRLLFWENFVTEEEVKPLMELDDARMATVNERMRVIDQCALEAGVYDARYDALMAELRRYIKEEPAKAEPFVHFGEFKALETYGSEMLRP